MSCPETQAAARNEATRRRSSEVRDELIRALRLDLIDPEPGSEQEREEPFAADEENGDDCRLPPAGGRGRGKPASNEVPGRDGLKVVVAARSANGMEKLGLALGTKSWKFTNATMRSLGEEVVMLKAPAGICRCVLTSIALLIVTVSGCRKSRNLTTPEVTRSPDRKKAEDTKLIMSEIARLLEEHRQNDSLPSETELRAEIERRNSDPLTYRPVPGPGPMLDAWKTPIRYEHLDDGKTFRLVSAGSDKVFEETTTPPLGERYERRWNEALEADLVYESGYFTRDMDDTAGLNEVGQAVVLMNRTGTACEAYALDHGDKYPMAESMSDLSAALKPHYVTKLHEIDPWGTPYAYRVSGDQHSYRVASAGPDRKFDDFSLQPPGSPRPAGTDDLVWENGHLIASSR